MSEEHARFVPLEFVRRSPEELQARAREFREELARRRSVRHFSDEDVPAAVLDECIRAAGSAPSGANRQPWTFVVVRDPEKKCAIRLAAESEERELYERRITPEWREALAPLGTDWHKPFLEIAPALIVVFRHVFGLEAGEKGARRRTNYYTQESVGIAVGFLIAALHRAGLATLPHTPSPMGFLADILRRPENEKAFVLLPVGYPSPGCQVPDLARKPLDEIRIVL